MEFIPNRGTTYCSQIKQSWPHPLERLAVCNGPVGQAQVDLLNMPLFMTIGLPIKNAHRLETRQNPPETGSSRLLGLNVPLTQVEQVKKNSENPEPKIHLDLAPVFGSIFTNSIDLWWCIPALLQDPAQRHCCLDVKRTYASGRLETKYLVGPVIKM